MFTGFGGKRKVGGIQAERGGFYFGRDAAWGEVE